MENKGNQTEHREVGEADTGRSIETELAQNGHLRKVERCKPHGGGERRQNRPVPRCFRLRRKAFDLVSASIRWPAGASWRASS